VDNPAAAEAVLSRPGTVVAPWVRAAVLYRLGRFADARAAFDAVATGLAARPLRDPGWLSLQWEAAALPSGADGK
jgi:hypothetical protein